jgi:hypothetical protein
VSLPGFYLGFEEGPYVRGILKKCCLRLAGENILGALPVIELDCGSNFGWLQSNNCVAAQKEASLA